MSLINQMLKDLEKRSPSGAPGGQGLPSGVVSAAGSGRRRRALWAGLLLVLPAVVGVVWFVRFTGPRPVAEPAGEVSAAPSPAAPAATVAVPVKALPAEAEQVSAREDDDPARLENLRLDRQADRLRVEAVFSGRPAYRLIRGEQGRQLVMELPGGVLAASLPDSAALPLLRSLAGEEGEEGARLVFSFNEPCRYEDLSLAEDPAGSGQTLRFAVESEPVELPPVAAQPASIFEAPDPGADAVRTADLKPPPLAADDSPAVDLVRQEVQPTPRQRAANLFRDGLSALQQGRSQEAETALRTVLAVEPAHIGARDLLLRVLVQQKRQAEIRDLLAEGVRDVPHHLPYRIHFARLLVEEGALDQARQELIRDPRPAIAEAPDLYALLATVHQRRGDYAEAARTYRLLLAVRPEQAVWWMGLGIALEGTGSYNQAGQAYRQALSRGGLSAGLQAYVRQRLAVLDSRKTQQSAAGANPGREQS